jgi:hypothetical protein
MPRVERNVRPPSIKGADDFVSDHASRAILSARGCSWNGPHRSACGRPQLTSVLQENGKNVNIRANLGVVCKSRINCVLLKLEQDFLRWPGTSVET